MRFASFLLDQLIPITEPNDVIRSLPARLREAGYVSSAVAELATRCEYPRARSSFYALLRAVSDDHPFSVMVRLWNLQVWVERTTVEKILSPQLVARLLSWGLLAADETCLASSVDIFPCMDTYLVTDHEIIMAKGERPEPVYFLGVDSYTLAYMTPRTPFMWGVDMCTGSGVHAVLAASHCRRVDAVDLSPRALDFASFNSGLNGVSSRIGLWRGNLFEALPPGGFDLIVTNPPWVPTPDGEIHLYRGGGYSGEDLTSRIVKAFPERLRVGGTACIYHEYPGYAERTFLDRVREWLGEGSWGLALVNHAHMPAAHYALGHSDSHGPDKVQEDYGRWLDSYERQGILTMSSATLYVLRLPKGQESWEVVREATFPGAQQTWVVDWLNVLWKLHQGAPQLRRGPGKCWFHPESGEAQVEWPGTCLSPLRLDSAQSRLVGLCDGQRNLTELAEALESSPDETLQRVQQLVRLGVLE